MKNIILTVIFLFSQIGHTSQKLNTISSKTYHLENETFSSLILTKEELIHLSVDDKTKYLFSMIALAQILEGSQRYQMSYEGEDAADQSSIKKSSQHQIFKWFNILNPEAKAFIFPILARLGLGTMLTKAGTYVVEKGAAALAAREAAKKAVIAVSEPRLAMDSIKEGSRLLVTQKGAMEAAKKVVIENAQKLKKAEEVLVKATNEKKGVDVAWKDYEKIKKTVHTTDQERFLAVGGSKKEFAGLLEESKIKSIFMWPFRNKTNLVVGGLATYGADNILLEKTGSSAADLLQNAKVSVSQFISGTDASGPGQQRPEPVSASDTKKEKDKSCLFGGTPSVWKDFGDGDLKCTRPKISDNSNCKKEDGQFQCPNYGVTLASGSIDKELCLPTFKLDDLTVRCSKALQNVIETKKASIEEKDLDQFGRSLKEAITSLEANDRMKDEAGQTKSISVYCQAKSNEQIKECEAIKEVIAVLKTTDIQKIYATRRIASAGSESGKSEAEKTKQ